MRNYSEPIAPSRCYAEFRMKAEEDREATQKAGHTVMKNVEFVNLYPIGDQNMVADKRVDDKIRKMYQAEYDAWREGEEIPTKGTWLKNWTLLSLEPAQVQNILTAGIRTVEDLAEAPEEALMAIGPGARGLKQRAGEWLLAAQSIGIPAVEIGKLADEVKELKEKLKKKTERVRDLQAVITDFKKDKTP